MKCIHCGSKCDENQKFCSNCGEQLENNNASSFNEHLLKEKLIGVNKEQIKKGNFSFPAFCFGPIYLFYRKMYSWGAIYFFLRIIILFFEHSLAIDICISLFIGFMFKKYYLKHIEKSIKELIDNHPRANMNELMYYASKQGGITWIPVIVYGVLLGFIFIFTVIMALMFAFSDIKLDENNYTVNLEYKIPANFHPNDENTASVKQYETEDKQCGFYVFETQKNAKHGNSGKVENMSMKKLDLVDSEENESKENNILINGYYWTELRNEKEGNTLYTLTLEEKMIKYEIKFAYILDEEHSYCSEAYDELKNSLKLTIKQNS